MSEQPELVMVPCTAGCVALVAIQTKAFRSGVLCPIHSRFGRTFATKTGRGIRSANGLQPREIEYLRQVYSSELQPLPPLFRTPWDKALT